MPPAAVAYGAFQVINKSSAFGVPSAFHTIIVNGYMSFVSVFPALASGVVATRPGTIMAASDRFQIHIEGRGGHAAMPHLAVDPVVAASAIVMGLQPLVSRETSPTDAAVISVTRVNTGTENLQMGGVKCC